MDLNLFLHLSLLSLALALVLVLGLWLISIPLRDISIIDMVFAVIILAITALCAYQGVASGWRAALIVGLVGIWALRITVHLVARNWGHGEDPRYSKLRTWVSSDRAFYWLSLRKVFLLQGVVLWLVTLPVQFAMANAAVSPPGVIVMLGAAIALVGLLFEAIADAQLKRFRANPANKGSVLQTGLWRYSRHPNYFGELCFWWGIFVIACEQPLGLVTAIGPLAYTYLIVNITGQVTLDKKLAREKPGYADYMARTSGMLPLPPKKL